MDDKTLLRKIYFFRIAHAADVLERLPKSLEVVGELPFTLQGRYQPDASDDILFTVFPDRITFPLRLRFGKTRRSNLPAIEEEGEMTALKLSENAGLIDICHIIIFEDGHAAAEFNANGPRISRLGDYLLFKGQNLETSPKFLPLFERNIVDVVKQLETVKVLEIEVPPDAEQLAREADKDLGSAINATAKAGATEKVSLTLTGNKSGVSKLRALTLRIAEMVNSERSKREGFIKVRASGYTSPTSKRTYIDLLDENLLSLEEFEKMSEKTTMLDSEAAYDVIESAYRRIHHKLATAAVADDFR